MGDIIKEAFLLHKITQSVNMYVQSKLPLSATYTLPLMRHSTVSDRRRAGDRKGEDGKQRGKEGRGREREEELRRVDGGREEKGKTYSSEWKTLLYLSISFPFLIPSLPPLLISLPFFPSSVFLSQPPFFLFFPSSPSLSLSVHPSPSSVPLSSFFLEYSFLLLPALFSPLPLPFLLLTSQPKIRAPMSCDRAVNSHVTAA